MAKTVMTPKKPVFPPGKAAPKIGGERFSTPAPYSKKAKFGSSSHLHKFGLK